MFFSGPRGSATSRPDRGCGGQYLVPIMIAIPSLNRLRQCLIEYVRIRSANKRNGGIGPDGWGGEKLANALKYFSAFPVIIFSALQRNLSVNQDTIGLTETSLYRCWVAAVFINSLYSFYWDVAKDWDLNLFSAIPRLFKSRSFNGPPLHPTSHPFGLRHRLCFPKKEIYYTVIFIDLLLRFTWSLKLSPHLDHFADFESGIFLLEFLEVARRWIWIFFRVETEWVRNTSNMGIPGQDDILLGDYSSGKDDDD